MATNRLPTASRRPHGNSDINLEIGARCLATCGSTLTFAQKTGVHVPWIEGLSGSFTPFNAISCLPLCVCQAGT